MSELLLKNLKKYLGYDIFVSFLGKQKNPENWWPPITLGKKYIVLPTIRAKKIAFVLQVN